MPKIPVMNVTSFCVQTRYSLPNNTTTLKRLFLQEPTLTLKWVEIFNFKSTRRAQSNGVSRFSLSGTSGPEAITRIIRDYTKTETKYCLHKDVMCFHFQMPVTLHLGEMSD